MGKGWPPDQPPQEDCCQALSIPPVLKYQSEGSPGIVEITRLLQASYDPLRDQFTFFKANVLLCLIGATDGHAKNFSIALTPGSRFTMTPLYDVLTVQSSLDAGQIQSKQMTLAMRVGKNRHYRVGEVTGRHFLETGLAAGLSRPQMETVFQEVANAGETAFYEAWSECRRISRIPLPLQWRKDLISASSGWSFPGRARWVVNGVRVPYPRAR